MFESNDTFVEQVVKAKPSAADHAPRYIFLSLGILTMIGSMLLAANFLMIPIIFFVLTYVFWTKNTEYEYDYTNGSLVIAKITNNAKRKVIASVESGNVRLIAAEGTNESLKYDHVQLKTINAGANDTNVKNYILVAHDEKKNTDFKIIFNPNEKLINAMKRYNKREIYE